MFKVKIFTVGKCKEPWLQAALNEYEKRLQNAIEWRLAKDTPQLIQWTQEESFIALTPDGQLLDSPAFSRKLAAFGARANFCIGDAEGLPLEILNRAQLRWSLSPLTFTHQMTRLILLEQIYRAKEIERGSQYHK
jgi:23S rRNA (pseudouridine1915-N3)-methyltransferase